MIKDLLKKIFIQQDKKTQETIEILKNIPVFSDLNWLDLRKLETIIHERDYAKDEEIFHEAETGAGMYIIKTGSVALTRQDSGQEIKLADLKEGEFFGELALLNETPRTATAKALTPTNLLGFFRPDLLNLLQRDPRLGSKVMMRLAQVISMRLQQANERIKG